MPEPEYFDGLIVGKPVVDMVVDAGEVKATETGWFEMGSRRTNIRVTRYEVEATANLRA
jgi:hypothetical protein